MTSETYGSQLLWRFLDEQQPRLLQAYLAGSTRARGDGRGASLVSTYEQVARTVRRGVRSLRGVGRGLVRRPANAAARPRAVSTPEARAPFAIHYRVRHGRRDQCHCASRVAVVRRSHVPARERPRRLPRVRPARARLGNGGRERRRFRRHCGETTASKRRRSSWRTGTRRGRSPTGRDALAVRAFRGGKPLAGSSFGHDVAEPPGDLGGASRRSTASAVRPISSLASAP